MMLVLVVLFFATAFTVYADEAPTKPRILIVPGHEPVYGGAEYGSIKERDLAAQLAVDLEEFLDLDGGYETFISRSPRGWTETFVDYFKDNWQNIITWRQNAKQEYSHLVAIGSTTRSAPTIIHNKVDADVGLRLYGVIKWANENNIDLMIHVHLNDDPGRTTLSPGKYSGFAIYVPTDAYGNSSSTRIIAQNISKRLSAYNPVSNLKQESGGIIPDPDLIAIGANDTSNVPSMLIEYGYIYEKKFTDPNTRGTALKELAYATYLGLQDFFGKDSTAAAGSHGAFILPYLWTNPVTATSTSKDIYILQTALSAFDMYPPAGKTKNDCPVSGTFGTCTKNALQAFQKKYNISGETNTAGEKTLEALHANF